MRESNTQSVKRFTKVAISILGIILIVTGIISGSYALVLLPEGKLECISFFVISVIALVIGICICFLVKEVPRYLAKTREMSVEEKVIHNIKTYMKKRKSRIVTCSVFLVFMIAISMFIMSMGNKLTETLTPEHFRLLAVAKLMVVHYLFGIFTGFIAFMLIDEFAGFTRNKHMLTLNMWERIQELENEVKELKAPKQVDGQQISDMDGGDSTSGVE